MKEGWKGVEKEAVRSGEEGFMVGRSSVNWGYARARACRVN